MVKGGLGPAEGRIDAGTLILAAGELRRHPHLSPVVTGGVRAVDQLVVLGRVPVSRRFSGDVVLPFQCVARSLPRLA